MKEKFMLEKEGKMTKEIQKQRKMKEIRREKELK